MNTADGPPPRRERADAAANRRRVLDAATRLFAAHGVAAVTTDAVAQAAGVGKGTLFRRFPSRAELCLAVAADRLEALDARARAELRALGEAGHGPLARLGWLLGELLRFNDAHLDLLFEAARAQGPAGHPPLNGQYELIVEATAAAVAAGELPAGFAPAVLADLLMAPVRPPILRLYRAMRGYSLEQIERELGLLLESLRRPPPGSAP